MERLTYSVAEAGELFGISRASAYTHVRTGEIPSITIGSRIVIPRRGSGRAASREGELVPRRSKGATGIREISPGVFQLIVSTGRDPLTGKYGRVHRTFRGTLTEAKVARAEFLLAVKKGRYGGASMTVDQLCEEWRQEHERNGRSPRTVGEYRRRYHHDIQSALGHLRVSKVTTKMLTDLHGAHQRQGSAPASVRKIHATISSMMSQACRWGWRDSNPAEWAEAPPIPETLPTVPEPSEVLRLISEAGRSRRPEHAEVIYFAATTGVRRGEICAIRRSCIDWEARSVRIDRAIGKDNGRKVEGPTKNRRRRVIAVDNRSQRMFTERIVEVDGWAEATGATLVDDPHVFSCSSTGGEPWDPDTITQFFGRLRRRLALDHVQFKSLRRFMDTYGQELGFSLAQVAIRAGHDPAVASKHYRPGRAG